MLNFATNAGTAGRAVNVSISCSCASFQSFRLCDRETTETDGISSFQLSKFPEFRIDHYGGTNETAQTRPIGSKQDGHITGEIDRAHRVGIVMDIRWMQTSFTAVGSSPNRLRPDQSDACPIGVVVNFPFGRKKGVDVFAGKKVRSAMWSIKDSQLPAIGIIRNE